MGCTQIRAGVPGRIPQLDHVERLARLHEPNRRKEPEAQPTTPNVAKASRAEGLSVPSSVPNVLQEEPPARREDAGQLDECGRPASGTL
jgi:hypothetical protein